MDELVDTPEVNMKAEIGVIEQSLGRQSVGTGSVAKAAAPEAKPQRIIGTLRGKLGIRY